MPNRLPPSPRPKNFADAVANQVKTAVDRLAGEDGRLSRSEAKKAPELQTSKSANVRAAVDNVERYFRGSHKKKPATSTVVEHARKDAAKAATRAAGDDGRLSAADAEKELPAHLYDNFVALRAGKGGKPPKAAKPTTPAEEPADSAPASPAAKPAKKPTKKPKLAPGPAKPKVDAELGSVTLAEVRKGAKLLKELLRKADNGDETLTPRELSAALANTEGGWVPDWTTVETMHAAVNKMKSQGDRSLDGIIAGIDATLAELEAVSGGGRLDEKLAKKAKTKLAVLLVRFAGVHAGDKASAFSFSAYNDPIYVPTKPFRAPRDADPLTFVQALVDHFNSYSNDNSTHGPRPASITRFVLGTVEVEGIAAEIEKLGRAEAKAALVELNRRIHQPNALGGEMSNRRVWVEPKAQPTLAALAERFGLDLDFKGDPVAPKFDYY